MTRWDPRQQAMLAEMGLRLWAPDAAAVPTVPTVEVPPAAADRPAAKAPTRPTPPPATVRPSAPVTTPAVAEAPVAVPAGAAASLDWPELEAAVAGCRACALCESRTQPVFGVGPRQADWLVVGEAPGEQEDLQGEPFVGPSGQLLDRMLAALGRSRAADAPAGRGVYIANTLKCRPPRNRNPSPEELLRCEPYLQRQIALLRPKLILAMGRFALQTLLKTDEPVGRLRGRVHHYQGVPLIVTYHPAYLLRSPLEKAKAWDDLCLAAAVAEQQGASAP
ncbi:uracil-DNA glycosylase family protein [Aquabacterium sp. J223]|uniref:uracil-DNA glycosylase n=1 Tax=Aquabacterium sp. J223 TaxID=2898431 RepID=UPI0021ADC2BB|nr:uracil-DNA glycosylase [Aquabacterium sp. J223]UUX96438.1 uracil-DNA glycosylase [Aquabacterium sp. J223]